MEPWMIVVIVGIVCAIGLPIGLPMLIGLVAVVLDHRREMAAIKANKGAAGADHEKLSAEYQEFVIGVDSHIQKIEERLRVIEAQQRRAGESGENQELRRG